VSPSSSLKFIPPWMKRELSSGTKQAPWKYLGEGALVSAADEDELSRLMILNFAVLGIQFWKSNSENHTWEIQFFDIQFWRKMEIQVVNM